MHAVGPDTKDRDMGSPSIQILCIPGSRWEDYVTDLHRTEICAITALLGYLVPSISAVGCFFEARYCSRL